MFFLNSRIPLVGISSWLAVNWKGKRARVWPRALGLPSKIHWRSRTSQTPCGTQAFPPHQTKIGPANHPASSASRATLYSKVTEPFCRLPLHPFCPKLEAINLEHLLRFVERLDWKLTLSLQFSWRTKKAGRGQKRCPLFKRKEKDQRIILINNSFKGQRAAPRTSCPARAATQPLFSLF